MFGEHAGMRTVSCLLGLSLAACSSADLEITLRFATPEARALTRTVAFTAFEPLLAQPDTIDQEPRFIGCDEVGVFPPTQVVDPDAITLVPNLAGIITERTEEAYPLDGDWSVELDSDSFLDINPWGAIMVYVEARGDARLPTGVRQLSTLLGGCFCVRTKEASSPNRELDRDVKAACQSIEGDNGITEKEVFLGPVVPEAFQLELDGGVGRLTAPRQEILSPGPRVRMSVNECGVSSGSACFECEQPCSELDNQSNVPVQFEIFRGTGLAPTETQIVLTDAQGIAEAEVEVGQCAEAVRVEAQVVGRTAPRILFDVDCVNTVDGFDCPIEVALDNAKAPKAISRVPGDPQLCQPGNTAACDKLAVLSDLTDGAVLEIIDTETGRTLTSTVFEGEKGHDLLGYYYRMAEPGRPASQPVIAVATSGLRSPNPLRLRIFEWRFEGNAWRLVPHDGGRGRLDSPCREWLCGSREPCSGPGTCRMGEQCSNGVCQRIEEEESPSCTLDGPVFCACRQNFILQSRITLRARDLDGDNLLDLAVSNSDKLTINFFYSGMSASDRLYSDNCICGQFGVAPNTFDLMTLGGQMPDRREADLVLGGDGGFFVQYADRSTFSSSVLRCGASGSVAGDVVTVQDIEAGPLRCREGEPSCNAYDDVVALSAASLTERGIVRVTTGSDTNLSFSADVPRSIRNRLLPRVIDGRAEPPEGPQRVRIADYNGDGHRDFAVLYGGSGEIHVWLGGSNGGFGEIFKGIGLNNCRASMAINCPPLAALAALDGDGDGADELAVVCSAASDPSVRLYVPKP